MPPAGTPGADALAAAPRTDSTLPMFSRTAVSLVGVLLCCALSQPVRALEPTPDLRTLPGFEAVLYADNDLAHDIHSLTIDAQGRVVVSGPGYIRILVDSNGDGRADEARTLAEPDGSAQGMYFHGADLLCTANGGLIRYRDRDGDDRADGPPQVFLQLKTGGEHDAHAVRRGPDGWWYILIGNAGRIGRRYVTTRTSPVNEPRAGVLMRLSPDLASGEIVAHGLRNAYDFTFDAVGEVFTCDSDGEREVSLPWYLPNRVLHLLPGSDAGWVTESWKRQDEFFDLAPVVASIGRGSPTGVVCYRHVQFPPEFQAALFVCDWTYGKVYALRPRQQGARVVADVVEFLSGAGTHGFAPTAAAVGPDGSLFISVGGRGTRGGVYRIRATSGPDVNLLDVPIPPTPDERLTYCLRCPEPLSSWSRRKWEPIAAELGSEPFIRAAQDESRLAVERLRAIEILTEKFHGLDGDLAEALTRAGPPAVRVRAAWSLGRSQPERPRAQLLAAYLDDPEPFVVRTALEALLGAAPDLLADLVQPLARVLSAEDRYVRQAAVRVVTRCDEDAYQAIAAAAAPAGWQAGLSLAAAYAERHSGLDAYTIDVALKVLAGRQPLDRKRDAVRLIQLALGDCGPAPPDAAAPRPPVFDAYAPTLDLAEHPEELARLQQALPDLYPMHDAVLDRELARVIAMVQPADSALVDRLLAAVTPLSHPVDDLHQLIVVARLPGPRTAAQRSALAAALLAIEPKLRERNCVQDSHWNDRVLEMYDGLAAADPELPVELLAHPEFGRPAHAQYLSQLPPRYLQQAVDLFARAALAGGDDYEWTDDVVYLLAQSDDPQVAALVRHQFGNYGLRGAVLLALAERPLESDRALFLAGLEESQFDVLEACIRALSLLPASQAADDNVPLLRALRRLGSEGRERKIRDQVAEALRRNLRQELGYQLGRDGDPQTRAVESWTSFIAARFPEEFARQTGADLRELEEIYRDLATVPWSRGDVKRGEVLFKQRACIQCHGSGRALGPDLAGVANRFSREDLFTAILFPSRDVSPRYQTELILTRDGHSYAGLVVYESVDGVVLRDAQNRTYRIESADVETRRKLPTSLMPSGLLKDLEPRDYADLYAYLSSLSAPRAERTAQEESVTD